MTIDTPEPAWYTALDEDDQDECRRELRELAEALYAGRPLHPGALESALAAWKATGEALSDPAVREVLTAEGFDEGDFTEVGPPAGDDDEVARLMAVSGEAYRDGYENGRTDERKALAESGPDRGEAAAISRGWTNGLLELAVWCEQKAAAVGEPDATTLKVVAAHARERAG